MMAQNVALDLSELLPVDADKVMWTMTHAH